MTLQRRRGCWSVPRDTPRGAATARVTGAVQARELPRRVAVPLRCISAYSIQLYIRRGMTQHQTPVQLSPPPVRASFGFSVRVPASRCSAPERSQLSRVSAIQPCKNAWTRPCGCGDGWEDRRVGRRRVARSGVSREELAEGQNLSPLRPRVAGLDCGPGETMGGE